LDVEQFASAERFLPCFERGKDVVRMEGLDPVGAEGFLDGESGERLPAPACGEDEAVGFGGPWDLGIKFDGVAIVVFALGEGLFGLLDVGDVDEGEGDADDLFCFVSCGLEGDEEGARDLGVAGVGATGFDGGGRLTVECSVKIGLVSLELFRAEDLGDVATQVSGYGEVVDFGEALVDADVAEIAVEETEADRDTVVDGVELGEALGRESLEAERRVGDGRTMVGSGMSDRGGETFGEGLCKLVGRDGAAVEPALTDVATEPEEHVGDGLVFDPLGDCGETETVAETYDGCGDLAALTSVIHGANEGGVDFEFVEGK
jgi:hypothetical protein